MEVYLDNAATTRVCGEAAAAAQYAMTECYGNPSSTHTAGRRAAALLKTAREQVSSALGCSPDELYFTSGGTESDNWALFAAAELNRRRGRHIISSRAEHEAVRKALEHLERRDFELTLLSPEPDGSIAARDVAKALREDTVLVSLMLVNNETGGMTDIAAVSRVLREARSGALLHTDAVQAFLKTPFSPASLGADLLSVSGHKIHAPKGTGALYIRKGLRLPPLLVGGGQEDGLRSGTEALPSVAAFGAAARIGRELMAETPVRIDRLRRSAVERLTHAVPGIVFIGGGSGHILSLSLPGYRSEVLMNYLESKGIYVAKSSACKRGARSHVLEAMGLGPSVIDGALRISLSRYTTQEEIDLFCSALQSARKELLPSLS